MAQGRQQEQLARFLRDVLGNNADDNGTSTKFSTQESTPGEVVIIRGRERIPVVFDTAARFRMFRESSNDLRKLKKTLLQQSQSQQPKSKPEEEEATREEPPVPVAGRTILYAIVSYVDQTLTLRGPAAVLKALDEFKDRTLRTMRADMTSIAKDVAKALPALTRQDVLDLLHMELARPEQFLEDSRTNDIVLEYIAGLIGVGIVLKGADQTLRLYPQTLTSGDPALFLCWREDALGGLGGFERIYGTTASSSSLMMTTTLMDVQRMLFLELNDAEKWGPLPKTKPELLSCAKRLGVSLHELKKAAASKGGGQLTKDAIGQGILAVRALVPPPPPPQPQGSPTFSCGAQSF